MIDIINHKFPQLFPTTVQTVSGNEGIISVPKDTPKAMLCKDNYFEIKNMEDI